MEMPAYLSRFLGKGVTDPFEVDKDIDSITRATVSVEALARTVKESSRRIAADALGITVKEDQLKSGSWSWLWLAFLFAFAGTGYVLTKRSPKIQRFRDLSPDSGIHSHRPLSLIAFFHTSCIQSADVQTVFISPLVFDRHRHSSVRDYCRPVLLRLALPLRSALGVPRQTAF